MRNVIRTAIALGVGSLVAGAAFAAPAAQKSFDGTWSVQMVTESGSCDRSATYTLAVDDNGGVRQLGGDGGARVSGRVGSDGGVNLAVDKSLARASAIGRLQGNSGSGVWNVSLVGCSGRWVAQRRTETAAAR